MQYEIIFGSEDHFEGFPYIIEFDQQQFDYCLKLFTSGKLKVITLYSMIGFMQRSLTEGSLTYAVLESVKCAIEHHSHWVLGKNFSLVEENEFYEDLGGECGMSANEARLAFNKIMIEFEVGE